MGRLAASIASSHFAEYRISNVELITGASQILIVGTIAIGLQLKYMLDKDLGFSTDSIVTISTPWQGNPARVKALRNALGTNSGNREFNVAGQFAIEWYGLFDDDKI